MKFIGRKTCPGRDTPMSGRGTPAQEDAQLEAGRQIVLDGLECDNSLAGLIQALTQGLGFEEHELATLTGVNARFVLLTGRNDETPYVERLDDLAAIAVLLISNGELNPRLVPGWFRSGNRDLRCARPLDALRERGFLPVYNAAEATCEFLMAREPAEAL